jgi:hypothetical protein
MASTAVMKAMRVRISLSKHLLRNPREAYFIRRDSHVCHVSCESAALTAKRNRTCNEYSYVFNTIGGRIGLGIRGNVVVGVAVRVDVSVVLAVGLSDCVALSVLAGVGGDPGVAAAGSTV